MNNQTMYETMSAVTELNHVEGFEPKELMREIGEEENKQLYLDVAIRKLWFRLKHPLGMIHKKIVQMTEQFAIVEARVYLEKGDSEDCFISNAFAQRHFSSGNEFGSKYLELAETAAVGRALADAGFGSQFADSECDIDPEQADAGVPLTVDTTVDLSDEQAEVVPNSGETASAAAIIPITPDIADKIPSANAEVTSVNGIKFQSKESAHIPFEPVQPSYDSKTDVNTILSQMTLDEAKNYVVTMGAHKGKKLGVIAVEDPKDLQWYINNYRGPDNILRAAATLLVNTALKEAG